MIRRKVLSIAIAAAFAVVVLAAGGYVFVQGRIQSRIEHGLRQLAANPPPPYTAIAYNDVDFTLHDRRLVITGLKADIGDTGHGIRVNRVEIANFNTETWQQLTQGRPPKAEFQRLFDKAVLKDVSTVAKGETSRAELVSVSGVNVRPLSPEAVAKLRSLSATQRAKEIFAHLRVDSIAIEAFQSEFGGNKYSIKRADLVGIEDERFKSVVVDNFEGARMEDKVSFARLELYGGKSHIWFSPMEAKTTEEKFAYLDLAAVKLADLRRIDMLDRDVGFGVAALEGNGITNGGIKSADARDVSLTVRSQGELLSMSAGAVELRDLDLGQYLAFLSQPVVPQTDEKDPAKIFQGILDRGEASKRMPMAIGRLAIRTIAFAPGITLAEASLSGKTAGGMSELEFASSELAFRAKEMKGHKTAVLLASVGYETLLLSLQTRVTANIDTGAIVMDRLRLWGPQVGQLQFSYAVSNYRTTPHVKPNPLSPLLEAKLDSMEIAWRDEGLTQRLLTFLARQNRIPAAGMRAAVIAQLREAARPYMASQRVYEAVNAAVAFLEQPGVITLQAMPSQPVTIGDLGKAFRPSPGVPGDYAALFDLLEVKAFAR